VSVVKLSRLLILFALLLAACASGPVGPDNGSFVAAETAPDATGGNATEVEHPADKPLTSTEEAEAALKINKLEVAAEGDERDKIIEELVALGPRYLAFYRSIEREEVALDMMYVIRRIEREHKIEQPAPPDNKDPDNKNPKDPDPKVGNDGPTIPEYNGKLDDFDRGEVERFMAARLEQARRLLDGGRYEQAQRIAEAAIVLLPDSRLRPEFDALVLKAKGESQSDLLIAGTLNLEPSNLQYAKPEKGAAFATPLNIRCFLKNVSTTPITLRLYEGEGKESILQLSVTYEQLDYAGNSMSQTGIVRLPIDAGESITLKPNDSYEIAVPLESLSSLDSDAPQKYALGAVKIEAALRVYGAFDGDGRALVLRPIRFPVRDLHVYPAKFKLDEAAKRPITTMRTAIKDGGAQDLFMTAHLVDVREKRNAGDLLVGKDYDDSTLSMQRARLRAMSVVFNTGKSWDIKRWREWWEENRLRQ